jgi:NTP pyrophosphatase (non-canonical NTP hydrolase)
MTASVPYGTLSKINREEMMSIRDLQERCGTAARDKGFHDDRPQPVMDQQGHITYPGLADWQGNKLMLIVSEVAEAQDELRKGFPANVTYHPNAIEGSEVLTHPYGPGGTPAKPEGVPSELADVVIRVLDFCFTENIDLESIIEEKLRYNALRPYKHGKKF